jgi:peptidoglycan-associated lipoprotein
MGKKMITGLNILTIVCSALLLMAACAKRQAPTQPTDVSVSEDAGKTKTDMVAVREKRIEDLKSPEQDSGIVSPEDIFSEKICFEYDRSDLNAEARSILKKIATELRLNPSYSIDIAGHCDERGTIEYNLALGERRARSAEKFIAALGISEDRISTVSYGEERPVDPRSTEEAWVENRRDEFTLIK